MSGEVTRALPDFLVIGSPRGGTTWLDASLRSHPDIALPDTKEVHFFDWYYDRGLEWYGEHFRVSERAEEVRGEVTPGYLSSPVAPVRIATTVPGAPLFAILRNPVARLYSNYGMRIRERGETRSFRDSLDAAPQMVGVGHYAEHLARYQALAPENPLHLLVFEEVVADPQAAYDAIGAVLGVNSRLFRAPDGALNESYSPMFPKARAAARRTRKWLGRTDQEWVVKSAKAMGLNRVFGASSSIPSIDAEDAKWSYTQYRHDIDYVEGYLGRRLETWHAVSAEG